MTMQIFTDGQIANTMAAIRSHVEHEQFARCAQRSFGAPVMILVKFGESEHVTTKMTVPIVPGALEYLAEKGVEWE